MAAPALEEQNQGTAAETAWPAKPKIFAMWFFKKKFADGYSRVTLIQLKNE